MSNLFRPTAASDTTSTGASLQPSSPSPPDTLAFSSQPHDSDSSSSSSATRVGPSGAIRLSQESNRLKFHERLEKLYALNRISSEIYMKLKLQHSSLFESRDNHNRKVIKMVFSAARKLDLRLMELCLAENPSDLEEAEDSIDPNNANSLFHTLLIGQERNAESDILVQMLEMLLNYCDNREDLIYMRNTSGVSPIMLACKYDWPRCFKLMMKFYKETDVMKCHTDLTTPFDTQAVVDGDKSPFQLAIESGSEECLCLMVRKFCNKKTTSLFEVPESTQYFNDWDSVDWNNVYDV